MISCSGRPVLIRFPPATIILQKSAAKKNYSRGTFSHNAFTHIPTNPPIVQSKLSIPKYPIRLQECGWCSIWYTDRNAKFKQLTPLMVLFAEFRSSFEKRWRSIVDASNWFYCCSSASSWPAGHQKATQRVRNVFFKENIWTQCLMPHEFNFTVHFGNIGKES